MSVLCMKRESFPKNVLENLTEQSYNSDVLFEPLTVVRELSNLEAQSPMNDYKNNYPTLLIHGFAGWGEDDGMSRNKWEFFRIYDEMFERVRKLPDAEDVL